LSYFEHMKDKGALPCSVSIEVVEHVAKLMPEYLLDKHNSPIVPRVLFMLGFQVDTRGMGYVEYKGVRIRNKDRPYLTHETTIFNGRVRNEVLRIDDEGSIIFCKTKPHFMERVYIENEILTLSGLDTTMMDNINDIGIEKFYTDGMAAMDKRFDPEKSLRNIVRP
jgi:hypothetical protein